MIRFGICLVPVIVSLYNALECPYFDSVSNQNKTLNNTCSTSDWLKWECNSCNNGNNNQTVVRHKVMCCPDNNITAFRHACNTTEANDTEYGSCTSYCPPTSTTTVSRTALSFGTTDTTTSILLSNISSRRTLATTQNLSSTKQSTMTSLETKTPTPVTLTSTRKIPINGSISTGILKISKSTTPKVSSTKRRTVKMLKASTALVTASSTVRTQSKSSPIFNISKITTPLMGLINTKTSITLQSTRKLTYRSNTTEKVSSLKSTTFNISSSTHSTRTGAIIRSSFKTTSQLDESSTTPQLASMAGTKSTTGIRFSTKSTNFLGSKSSRPSFKSTITDTTSTAYKHSQSHIPDSSFPLSTVAKSRSDPTVSPVTSTSRPITTNTAMSNNGNRTSMMSPTRPSTGTQTPLRFNQTGRNTLDKYRGGLDCLNGTLNDTVCNNGTKTNNKETGSTNNSDDNGLSSTAVGAIAGCVSAVGLAGTVLAVVMVIKRVKRRVEPFGQDPEVDQSLEES